MDSSLLVWISIIFCSLRINLKIIINTSNLQKGGALQVALSMLNEANKNTDHQFFAFLGRESSKVINEEEFDNLSFYHCNIHPTDSIFSFFKFNRILSNWEQEISADRVITIFGPCYWKPKAKHIMGFANGYLLYEDTYFFTKYPVHKSISYRLKKILHQLFLKREAQLYWTETQDSKIRLSRFLSRNENAVVVASNNASNYFREKELAELDKLTPKNYFRLVYVSSYYQHKGFEILKEIVDILNVNNQQIELVVTLNDKDYDQCFVDSKGVINIGPVHPKYCPSIYDSSDVVIIPSLLETFSASYPEAMISNKPIITSDLPFARDICEEAALYFDPSNPQSAVDHIVNLMNSKELYKEQVKFGNERVLEFDLPENRFDKILNKIIN